MRYCVNLHVFVSGLMSIRDMEEDALVAADLPFSTPSASGLTVQLSTKHHKITYENKLEYCKLALNYRYVDIAKTSLNTEN